MPPLDLLLQRLIFPWLFTMSVSSSLVPNIVVSQCKRGLKFAPKVPVKKAAKLVPKKYVLGSTFTFL
jgi:hypothetical protein